jgi:hypothetical protein
MGQLVDFLYHTTKWVKPIHYPLYFFGHVGQRLGRPILTDLHPAVLPLWVLSSEVTDRPEPNPNTTTESIGAIV